MAINIGDTIGNIGHTLGLPEFGISERLGGTNQDTAFGGNLTPQQQQNSRDIGIQLQRSGVPTYGAGGAQSSAPIQQTGGQSTAIASPNIGGNSNRGSSGPDLSNPSKQTDYARQQGFDTWDQYQDSLRNSVVGSQPSQGELDSVFNPIFDVYNQAESNLRGQVPGLISEAEAQAQASQGLIGDQRTGANELLGQQQTSTENLRGSQVADQRRILQELGQANQARFGGSSSAGQAASEIQGREFQRSRFGIQQNAQEALQAIGQQKQVVEREFQQGMQQIELNRQTSTNEINRNFQDKLLEINARRGETASNKANARREQLQDYRNKVYQVNLGLEEFRRNLQLQAQSDLQNLSQSELQFTGASNQGGQALGIFGQTTPTAIPGVQQGQTQQSPNLTGSIRDEDLRGSIAGSSERDPRFQNFQPQFSR